MENNPAIHPQGGTLPELLTLAEAAKHLGRCGRRPSIPTLWRWCVSGVHGVKLRHLKIGRAIMLEPAALMEFGYALAKADAQNTTTADGGKAPRPASQSRRARDIESAKDSLRRRGVLS